MFYELDQQSPTLFAIIYRAKLVLPAKAASCIDDVAAGIHTVAVHLNYKGRIREAESQGTTAAKYWLTVVNTRNQYSPFDDVSTVVEA